MPETNTYSVQEIMNRVLDTALSRIRVADLAAATGLAGAEYQIQEISNLVFDSTNNRLMLGG